ncbi:MAG: alpha/beta hydrolase [Eggerthellaceae bacterium]|nr:alpha/beta hydrolase [Eggerthellaceae bacterium]
MAKVISTQATAHPLPDDLVFHGDLSYEGAGAAPLAADVYRPKDASADPLPIAVFVHGGGLFVGSRKANREYAELLAERGYVVFVPEYRLIDETDGIGIISDVCSGLSYLKDHAAELGGNPSRILMIGESAGGFLALYATALAKSPLLQETFGIEAPKLSVRGLASFGGMLYTANTDLIGLVYRRDMYGERLRNANFKALMNPETPQVELNLPPMLQVTSKADFLKSYTLRYNSALMLAGHDHRLIYYNECKELKHAFPSLHPELPQSKEVLDELDAWFKRL